MRSAVASILLIASAGAAAAQQRQVIHGPGDVLPEGPTRALDGGRKRAVARCAGGDRVFGGGGVRAAGRRQRPVNRTTPNTNPTVVTAWPTQKRNIHLTTRASSAPLESGDSLRVRSAQVVSNRLR